MSVSLGGNVCIRNGNELDYPWRECIQSLLPVCDKVFVSDGESTDGTQEELREWMTREPRIVLNVYPWPNPHNKPDFWVDWLNYCRENVRCQYHFQLDADEILSEQSYPAVEAFKREADNRRVLAWCKRHNFWQDHRHIIPIGHCCSARVIRIAPQDTWLASDGYHPKANYDGITWLETPVELHHYGFLRHPSQFFRKEELLQNYFFGDFDKRLRDAQDQTKDDPKKWMNVCKTGWEHLPLVEYSGAHPAVIHNWLVSHGFKD